MIREFRVKNYKSILDNTVELGRFNVFIGENGCGKTNLLEAMAMAAGGVTKKLDTEELYARGIRIAKPSITWSSFANVKADQEIQFQFTLTGKDTIVTKATKSTISITSANRDNIYAEWHAEGEYDKLTRELEELKDLPIENRAQQLWRFAELVFDDPLKIELSDFAIYNINHLALRGIQTTSMRSPLGINGESLDVLIASFNKSNTKELLSRSRVVPWVDKVLLDTEDELKIKGHKLGRSTSLLYFKDKFMRRSNNLFSAENANEGILHVLFYLALFISDKTPHIFGIDNIESALNPQLCRDLIKELAALSKTHDKQALITTHNPAILDGLNLHDDEQRLFVVSRNDEGHTVTERIRMKPSVDGEKFKLSELWMRGHLGGLPTGF
jgi:AAA15 family ATPase/GTPase